MSYVITEGILKVQSDDAVKDYETIEYGMVTTPWRYKDIHTVIIEDGTEKIGEYAFCQMRMLREVIIPASVKKIGKHAFEKCENLRSIKLPEGIEEIESSTFKDCEALEDVVFPKRLRRIYRWAFSECKSLKNLVLPDRLEAISSTAFWGVDIGRSDFIKESERFCVLNDCLYDQINHKLIMGADVKEITVPEETRTIEEFAFYRKKNLEKVSLPATVKFIGEYAFSECPKLREIAFADKNLKAEKNVLAGSYNCQIKFEHTERGIRRNMTAIERLESIACTRSCAVSVNGSTLLISGGDYRDFDRPAFFADAPYKAVAAGFSEVYVLNERGTVSMYKKSVLRSEAKKKTNPWEEYGAYLKDRLAYGRSEKETAVLDLRKNGVSVKSISASECSVSCVLNDRRVWSNVAGKDRSWRDWRNVRQTGTMYQDVVALFEDGTLEALSNDVQDSIKDWTDVIQIDAWGPYYCNPYIIGLQKNGRILFASVYGNNGKDSSEFKGWTNMIQVSCCNGRAMGLRDDGNVYKYNRGETKIITDYKNVTAVRCAFDADVLLLDDGSLVLI